MLCMCVLRKFDFFYTYLTFYEKSSLNRSTEILGKIL